MVGDQVSDQVSDQVAALIAAISGDERNALAVENPWTLPSGHLPKKLPESRSCPGLDRIYPARFPPQSLSTLPTDPQGKEMA
ncbi:hypothetical protein MASR2M79_22200 [Aminivibrio sp.]